MISLDCSNKTRSIVFSLILILGSLLQQVVLIDIKQGLLAQASSADHLYRLLE
jgi:hypothetical protein